MEGVVEGIDLGILEQLNIPFIQSVWFWLGLLIMSGVMEAIKDKDFKVHKRWYSPIALVLSIAASAIIILINTSYVWSDMVVQVIALYFGQQYIGDQLLKRFKNKDKDK